MREVRKSVICATKHLQLMILLLYIVLASGCGLGPYFLDDGVRLVHDAKNGEYIGERIGECRVINKETGKEVVYYKVERKDGSVVEMPAEKVTLSKP